MILNYFNIRLVKRQGKGLVLWLKECWLEFSSLKSWIHSMMTNNIVD